MLTATFGLIPGLDRYDLVKIEWITEKQDTVLGSMRIVIMWHDSLSYTLATKNYLLPIKFYVS